MTLDQANKDLGAAQREMFSGKSDQAIARLDAIRDAIVQAKDAGEAEPKIKTAENKYMKLVKDLEKRTGQNLGGGTLTAAASSSQPELAKVPQGKAAGAPSGGSGLPPKPKAPPMGSSQSTPRPAPVPKPGPAPRTGSAPAPAQQAPAGKGPGPLPHAVREYTDPIERDMLMVGSSIEYIEDPNYNGDKEILVSSVTSKLNKFKKDIESAKAAAMEKGAADHPELAELAQEVAEAVQKADAAIKAYTEAKDQAEGLIRELEKEVQALEGELEKADDFFRQHSSRGQSFNALEEAEAELAALAQYKETLRPGLVTALDTFGQIYGTEEQEIDKALEEKGFHGHAGRTFRRISEGVADVDQAPKAAAEAILEKVGLLKHQCSGIGHEFAKIEQINGVKAWVEMAVKFAPENPDVARAREDVSPWMDMTMADLNAAIDARTWPEKAADAPDLPESDLAAAKALLDKEHARLDAKDGEKRTLVSMVGTGPWRVFKKDVLGHPVQYALPMTVAITLDSETDLARVFQINLLTEENQSPQKAAPFVGTSVGESYYIRPRALEVAP